MDRLREVGLYVPQSTELMYLMKKNGFKDADTHIINEEKCAEYLLGILK